jgi:phage-related minor tail protein
LSPERQQAIRDQRAYAQGLREKARELRAQVEAGTLTRDAMAEQLKAYREANRPARPEGARKPKP